MKKVKKKILEFLIAEKITSDHLPKESNIFL